MDLVQEPLTPENVRHLREVVNSLPLTSIIGRTMPIGSQSDLGQPMYGLTEPEEVLSPLSLSPFYALRNIVPQDVGEFLQCNPVSNGTPLVTTPQSDPSEDCFSTQSPSDYNSTSAPVKSLSEILQRPLVEVPNSEETEDLSDLEIVPPGLSPAPPRQFPIHQVDVIQIQARDSPQVEDLGHKPNGIGEAIPRKYITQLNNYYSNPLSSICPIFDSGLPHIQAGKTALIVTDPTTSLQNGSPREPFLFQSPTPPEQTIAERSTIDKTQQSDTSSSYSLSPIDDSFTLLRPPPQRVSASRLYQPTVQLILGYGPFEVETSTTEDIPFRFEYCIYLHYTSETTDVMKYAYANPPHHSMVIIDLEKFITDDFIIGLNYNQLLFLILATALYCFGNDISKGTLINEAHLLYPWVPTTCITDAIIYHYPMVEVLLTIATCLLYEPEGKYAQLLKEFHPRQARTILLIPELEPSLEEEADEDDEIEIDEESSGESPEWEEVSISSYESGSTDPLNIRPRLRIQPTTFTHRLQPSPLRHEIVLQDEEESLGSYEPSDCSCSITHCKGNTLTLRAPSPMLRTPSLTNAHRH